MGIDKYKLIFKTLRFFGAIFFQPNTLWLDVLRIWQVSPSHVLSDKTVSAVCLPWTHVRPTEHETEIIFSVCDQ
jgi:hypothetical protein